MILRLSAGTLHVRAANDAFHWALDREGRILAGHEAGTHHRVALDYGLVSRSGASVPRRLSTPEGDQVLARAGAVLREAGKLLGGGQARLELDADSDTDVHGSATVLALLDRAAARAAAPELERAAYSRVYGPVRMVPPDCAQALVLQLTEGCGWGRCTFCTLYAGVRFRRKGREALARHIEGVVGLLGAGAALRTRLFLGDANALLAPQELVLAALAAGRARFPEAARRGADCFVDAFSGLGRSVAELRQLRKAGLRRVTFGLESGSELLLRRLGKPSTGARVLELARRARRAGLCLGVTVLAGVGGPELGEAHVTQTLRAVRELSLGPEDLVFLSPLVGPQGGGLPLPGPEEVEAQTARLRQGLAEGTWRVALYDIRRAVH